MATINDAVREMYLTQTGRAADPGGLEYFANRFGTSIEPDELAIFRQMAADEVAGQEARQAAAAQQQAAQQQAAALAAQQQQQIAQQQAQQQAEEAAQRAIAATRQTSSYGTGATTAVAQPLTNEAVRQAYLTVLGREPDAAGLEYFSNRFGAEVDPTELSTFSVMAQPELAARPTTNNAIRQMYLSVLGREPDASGLKYFSDRFGADVDASELGIFRGMSTQELAANAARDAGTTTSLTGTGTPGATTSLTGTTAGTVQPITRPPPVRQVTSSQLAPASFTQTAITGTPFTNVYTPANVQQNAPRLSDIQAAAQSANPYQSLMSLTPQRTLSPAYAAQAGQTTANTNLGGYDTSLYSQPLTGLLAPSTVAGGGGTDLVNNSGDQRGPGTNNTASNIDPLALGMARVANLFSSGTQLNPAPITTGVFNPVGTVNPPDATGSRGDYGGIGGVTGGADTMGFGGEYAKGGKVNMAPQMHNPPGPDDGYAALDNGEYVIRKSAVKKYGSNIFEQINAGKIPAQRLKSLLE